MLASTHIADFFSHTMKYCNFCDGENETSSMTEKHTRKRKLRPLWENIFSLPVESQVLILFLHFRNRGLILSWLTFTQIDISLDLILHSFRAFKSVDPGFLNFIKKVDWWILRLLSCCYVKLHIWSMFDPLQLQIDEFHYHRIRLLN